MSISKKNNTTALHGHSHAAARFLGSMGSSTDEEKGKMHPSYRRLMDAAASLRGVYGEAALTEALHSNDQQKINNWQRRGVSKDGAIDAERYIGCPAIYILEGTMPPLDDWTKLQKILAEQNPAPYERAEVRELRDLAMSMDTESIRALILLMKKL